MSTVAIIGGSGVDLLPGLEIETYGDAGTPFGAASAAPVRGRFHGVSVLFLPRHGPDHAIAPHRINYRANLWALAEAGAGCVVALAAVGGIAAAARPGRLAIPHQIVDYTWGRAHSLCDGDAGPLEHVDFTEPYDAGVRGTLIAAARAAGIDVLDGGVYGATQGPRLETAAEIERMARDGCDLVGMTGMPEAALARELGLPYACCALIANRAAGRGDGPITMTDIHANLARARDAALELLAAAVPRLAGLDRQA